MARKTLSILLALCMVLSLMPFGAFAAENDTVTYELTDQLVEGVEYLIVSANDGEAVALTNDGGSKGTTPVTIVDGKIELDNANAVWTSATDSSGKLNLGNGGKWLKGASGGLSFSNSMVTDRTWTYVSNQLISYGAYKVYYDATNNEFVSSRSTSEKVYLFAKEGSIAPPAQLEPGTYMIVISGHALTANRSAEKQENAGGWGYTASTYTGLDAVAYTEGMAFSSSMVWTVSAVEGGFAISNNGNRLVGTYVSGSSLNQGDLNVGEAEDVWTLSSGKLVSANAGKQLAYESAQNMFTVRSSGGDVTLVPVDPADACQHEEFDVVGEKAATCTEDGYTGDVVCSNCGEVLESGEVVAALGHNWGEWTVVTPAGDTTPGEETRTCSRCGEVETRELEPLNAPTYEQADRLVDGVEYLIVSTNQDGTAYILANPGASSSGTALGSKEATIVNGKIKVVAPDALWTATANGNRFNLSNEGGYLEGRSGNVKIYDKVNYTDRGWEYKDNQLQHVGGTYPYNLYYVDGFGGSSTNNLDAKVYLFALEGAVLPCQHDEVNVIGEKAATCTEDGYTGDIVCASCGVELEKGEVVPALGHNWSEWTVTVPVGEYTPGEETRTCSRCGETEIREIEPLHIPTYEQVDRLVDGVEYLIVSTNQDGTAYLVTNPGATSGGAAMGKTEVTIADGKITGYHDGTLWTATSEAGQMKLINDGGYLEGGSNAIKIYTAPKYTDRGWTYTDSFLQYVGGTYTYELYYTGTSFTHRSFNSGSAMNSVYLFALEGAVQPCQHENLTEHAAKAANCTEAGNDAYWECNDCHKLFSDAAAQTEIDEPVVYEALGHVWGEWETVTAPGATTRGSEKRVCSRCGEEETRATDPTGDLEPGTYVIVIGGNAVTTVRSANSAQGGTTDYIYTGLDGVPYVDGETEATAEMIFTVEAVEGGYVIHSGDSYLSGTYAGTTGDLAISDQSDVWVIDGTMLKSTNASAGNSGKFLGYHIAEDMFSMRSYRPESPDANLELDVVFYPVEAFVCDHASTVVRDAVEATCTEAGYTGDTYCTVCGEKLADGEEIPALGHSWDEGVVTTRPTGAAEGVKTFTCLRCGETRTESIPKLVNPFVDVAAGKFYFEPVLWAFYSDPQVTSGVTDTTFMPDRICTRAHVVTFLWRANGCPEPQSLTSEFMDVKDTSKYYYKAVLWAAEQGITTGYKDGTFRPDAECTRGQVVTFLWRANGSPDPTSTTNPFADVANGQYYTTAVLWAVEQGITQGRTPTTFGPNDSCTRGHVVTFLYRAYA